MVGKLTPNYFLWQRCQNLWQRCQNILESFGVKRLLHLKKIHDTITQSLFLKVYLILPPHTKIESYFYFDATRQVKMPKLMNLINISKLINIVDFFGQNTFKLICTTYLINNTIS